MSAKQTGPAASPDAFDVVIVGAGFAGLYMLHLTRRLGLSATIIERGDEVGGTWYWNRYPGARCDVDAVDYSFSFSDDLQREWEWSERYPTQPEILEYLNHVADRFDLRRDIELSTSVTSARYHEASARWLVETDRRPEAISCKYFVLAIGSLTSSPKDPEFEGLETFEGESYQTSRWPKTDVDFAGKRVGVIGTGSSGIQTIPVVAELADHLTVFQRTPNFSIPANNAPLDPEFVAQVKASYPARRKLARQTPSGMPVAPTYDSVLDLSEEELESELEALWTQGGTPILWHFADVRRNPESNRRVANFVRRKIRETVEDAAVAEQLTPTDHPFGTKRPCFDSNYFQTFNRPNVDLVDLRRAPIERITPAGVRTSDGEYPLDMLIFALGFDAFTGGFFNMNIHGRDVSLREAWAGGARSYLGLATSGFPNLFMVGGPLGPLVFTAALTTLEQDVEWIADCMAYMEQRGVASIEATPDAEDRWVETVNSEVSHTLYPLAKGSWYFGANIPGKPRAILGYLGGLHTHRRLCNGVATNGYEGFSLTTGRGV